MNIPFICEISVFVVKFADRSHTVLGHNLTICTARCNLNFAESALLGELSGRTVFLVGDFYFFACHNNQLSYLCRQYKYRTFITIIS